MRRMAIRLTVLALLVSVVFLGWKLDLFSKSTQTPEVETRTEVEEMLTSLTLPTTQPKSKLEEAKHFDPAPVTVPAENPIAQGQTQLLNPPEPSRAAIPLPMMVQVKESPKQEMPTPKKELTPAPKIDWEIHIYPLGEGEEFPEVVERLFDTILPRYDRGEKVEYFPAAHAVVVCHTREHHKLLAELMPRLAAAKTGEEKNLILLQKGYELASAAQNKTEAKRLATKILEWDATFFAKPKNETVEQKVMDAKPADLRNATDSNLPPPPRVDSELAPKEYIPPASILPAPAKDTPIPPAAHQEVPSKEGAASPPTPLPNNPELQFLKKEFDKQWKLDQPLIKEPAAGEKK